MNRVYSIDYLRGALALLVLIYHFCSWTIGVPESGNFLGRMGIYAVSMFYVISGMSMYLSYKSTDWSLTSSVSFYVRRIFRLAPVYWIALTLTIIPVLASDPSKIDWIKYILNMTLSFGYIDFGAYMVNGGWSIGNEVFFYIFFPLMIVATRSMWSLLALFLVSLVIYGYFAFFVIDENSLLAESWLTYINPLNQIFLFISGIVISWLSFNGVSVSNRVSAILIAGATIAFFAYPVSGDKINIITGVNRLSFTAISLVLCFGVYNYRGLIHNKLESSLKLLGDISYPVYLMHGIMYVYFNKIILSRIGIESPVVKLAICLFILLPIIIATSYYIYKLIELPAISIGKSITTIEKIQRKPA